jgi:excisionase family DNA binding protein
MQRQLPPCLSVDEAAKALGCSPQTVRRLLRAGRLVGRKLGREWVVWYTTETSAVKTPGPRTRKGNAVLQQPTTATIRRRLREVGTLLIAVGNHVAQARKGRGQLFLTWRTPHALRITLAIGRESPTKGWSPHALGVELPFWLAERTHWRQVVPLLRRYEQLRSWCAPRLLRIAGVSDAVLAELSRLEVALQAMAETMPAQEPQA